MIQRTNIFFNYIAALAVIGFTIIFVQLTDAKPNCARNVTSSFLELTAQNGYISEEHPVITEDGYILSIFRIYRRGKYQQSVKTTPVLLVHGMLQDSGAWIDPGPDAGLAYLLSDEGYDVWVGNTRGNRYAMTHLYLNPDVDANYWQFSADEMGSYDIPAMINYVLDITKSPNLNYIGFSQGAGSALMTFAEKPEYCKKVNVFISLAAPTTLEYMTSILRTVLQTSAQYERFINKADIYNVFSNNSLIQQLDRRLCSYYMDRNPFCKIIFDVFDIPHPGSVTDATYKNICDHFPAPTSIRTFARYGQVIESGRFQKYDYGLMENIKRYGSSVPPEYNLAFVSVPVVIMTGLSDTFVDVRDSKRLASRLPNVEELFIVNDSKWNHFDMTNSRYTKERIFPKVNQYLHKYSIF